MKRVFRRTAVSMLGAIEAVQWQNQEQENQPDQSCTDHPNLEETHMSRRKDLSENWPAGSRRYKRKRAASEGGPYKSMKWD